MAKPETIRVELSAADRRLLQRVVDALERKTPKGRLTEPAKITEDHLELMKVTGLYSPSEIAELRERHLGHETGVETNPRLMEKLTGNAVPHIADRSADLRYLGDD